MLQPRRNLTRRRRAGSRLDLENKCITGQVFLEVLRFENERKEKEKREKEEKRKEREWLLAEKRKKAEERKERLKEKAKKRKRTEEAKKSKNQVLRVSLRMPPKNAVESQLSDVVQGARRPLKTFEI